MIECVQLMAAAAAALSNVRDGPIISHAARNGPRDVREADRPTACSSTRPALTPDDAYSIAATCE